MPGSIKLPHTCPKCKETTAKTHQELEKLFGFRNLSPSSASNQSWCRDCR
jgi:hypothetical protein